MRISMMPTAKKKLGAIGLFARTSSHGTTDAGTGSNPRAGVVGLPATPAAPALSGTTTVTAGGPGVSHGHATNNAHHQQKQQPPLSQLQPPPEIIAKTSSTPATATARSILPVPKAGRSSFGTALSGQQQVQQPHASTSLPSAAAQHQLHFHPMQRTRTSASDTAVRDAPRAQNAWEDSTVASMFNDTESRAASDRTHARHGSHGRQYSTDATTTIAPYQRPLQYQTHSHPPPPPPPQPQFNLNRNQPQTLLPPPSSAQDENLPFVIEGGELKVIAPAGRKTNIPPPVQNAANSNNILHDHYKSDDAYAEDRAPFETPTKGNGLRRVRLPYRETRDYKNGFESSPMQSEQNSPPRINGRAESLSMSPERAVEAGEHADALRIEERRKRDRERQREREREQDRQLQRELALERDLQHKRSTVFENLTPLEFDTPNFNDTQAGHMGTSGVDPDELTEALQRTPRGPPPNRQLPLIPTKAPVTIVPLTVTVPGLGRNNSRRVKEKDQPESQPVQTSSSSSKSLKRKASLDYNDAELHAMSYAALKGQDFDYDPQAAALQQTTIPPTGGTIEDRLEHFKTKSSVDQQDFFTRITLNEWDEAGDWFLEQFGTVVAKMKQARKAKRQLMQQYEEEISAREEAVRGKIENIGRTLDDLKQEGLSMMQGKDMDLE